MLVARSVHELRNPVSRIRNIIRWLRRHSPAEPLDVKLRDAAGDIEVLRRLVDQVDIYRGGASDEKTVTRIFGDIIFKEVAQLRPRLNELGIPDSNISIETHSVSLIPPLMLNKSAVQQIISNLVENAVKYRNEDNGYFKMTFIGDFDTGYYKIRVQDWGIGVPEGWEERIFLDGERALNALQRSVTGMGMGLFIAREMARNMEGDLKLVRKTHPTEFVFEVPKGLRQ
jgi:signal transduction histidine kinase